MTTQTELDNGSTEDERDNQDGITLFTEDGEEVTVRVMDEEGEFVPYLGSPEKGFYAYENQSERLTIILE